MSDSNTKRHSVFAIIIIALGVLMAVAFMLIGLINLISPDVPASAFDENTLVSITLIFTSVLLIYSLFRPHSGGYLLCACAFAFSFVFHFHFFWILAAILILLLGILSVIRAHHTKRKNVGTSSKIS
jgi:hypothetical protein